MDEQTDRRMEGWKDGTQQGQYNVIKVSLRSTMVSKGHSFNKVPGQTHRPTDQQTDKVMYTAAQDKVIQGQQGQSKVSKVNLRSAKVSKGHNFNKVPRQTDRQTEGRTDIVMYRAAQGS